MPPEDAPPGVTVYGAPWCPDCKRAKSFLSEQRVAFHWIDIGEDEAGRAAVERLQDGGHTIPTITFDDGSVLVEPSNEELARKLGLTLAAQRRCYDVAIAGGGPAGLSAAIYAAREGLTAVVVERAGLGGQAGVTQRIDNYPGFPEGIGGGELAERFIAQAKRYGVELLSAVGVEKLEPDVDGLSVRLGNGQDIVASAVIVATGSTYRRLGVPGEEKLIGSGVHYCATCDGPFYKGAEELMVVGGGNSALEEGLFLTQFSKKVRIIQQLPQLTASPLLQERVTADDHFVIEKSTEVAELHGDSKLDEVVVRRTDGKQEESLHPAALFVFIGLEPQTEFLRGTLDLDEKGFVVERGGFATSMPGVFVAGDARQGSTKQLGAAVGEGIAALLSVRAYLEKQHDLARRPCD